MTVCVVGVVGWLAGCVASPSFTTFVTFVTFSTGCDAGSSTVVGSEAGWDAGCWTVCDVPVVLPVDPPVVSPLELPVEEPVEPLLEPPEEPPDDPIPILMGPMPIESADWLELTVFMHFPFPIGNDAISLPQAANATIIRIFVEVFISPCYHFTGRE